MSCRRTSLSRDTFVSGSRLSIASSVDDEDYIPRMLGVRRSSFWDINQWPHLASLYASTHALDEEGKNPEPVMGQDNIFDPNDPAYAPFRFYQPPPIRSEFSLEEPVYANRPVYKDEESRSSDRTSGDSFRRGSTCRVLLCVFLVLSFIGVVVAAITLAVLLSKTPRPRQIPSTLEEFESTATLLGVDFDEKLLDNTSREFAEMEKDFCRAMEQIFTENDSPVKKEFEDCRVTEFSKGSVKVKFRLKLRLQQSGDNKEDDKLHHLIEGYFAKKIQESGPWQRLKFDPEFYRRFVKIEPTTKKDIAPSTEPTRPTTMTRVTSPIHTKSSIVKLADTTTPSSTKTTIRAQPASIDTTRKGIPTDKSTTLATTKSSSILSTNETFERAIVDTKEMMLDFNLTDSTDHLATVTVPDTQTNESVVETSSLMDASTADPVKSKSFTTPIVDTLQPYTDSTDIVDYNFTDYMFNNDTETTPSVAEMDLVTNVTTSVPVTDTMESNISRAESVSTTEATSSGDVLVTTSAISFAQTTSDLSPRDTTSVHESLTTVIVPETLERMLQHTEQLTTDSNTPQNGTTVFATKSDAGTESTTAGISDKATTDSVESLSIGTTDAATAVTTTGVQSTADTTLPIMDVSSRTELVESTSNLLDNINTTTGTEASTTDEMSISNKTSTQFPDEKETSIGIQTTTSFSQVTSTVSDETASHPVTNSLVKELRSQGDEPSIVVQPFTPLDDTRTSKEYTTQILSTKRTDDKNGTTETFVHHTTPMPIKGGSQTEVPKLYSTMSTEHDNHTYQTIIYTTDNYTTWTPTTEGYTVSSTEMKVSTTMKTSESDPPAREEHTIAISVNKSSIDSNNTIFEVSSLENGTTITEFSVTTSAMPNITDTNSLSVTTAHDTAFTTPNVVPGSRENVSSLVDHSTITQPGSIADFIKPFPKPDTSSSNASAFDENLKLIDTPQANYTTDVNDPTVLINETEVSLSGEVINGSTPNIVSVEEKPTTPIQITNRAVEPLNNTIKSFEISSDVSIKSNPNVTAGFPNENTSSEALTDYLNETMAYTESSDSNTTLPITIYNETISTIEDSSNRAPTETTEANTFQSNVTVSMYNHSESTAYTEADITSEQTTPMLATTVPIVEFTESQNTTDVVPLATRDPKTHFGQVINGSTEPSKRETTETILSTSGSTVQDTNTLSETTTKNILMVDAETNTVNQNVTEQNASNATDTLSTQGNIEARNETKANETITLDTPVVTGETDVTNEESAFTSIGDIVPPTNPLVISVGPQDRVHIENATEKISPHGTENRTSVEMMETSVLPDAESTPLFNALDTDSNLTKINEDISDNQSQANENASTVATSQDSTQSIPNATESGMANQQGNTTFGLTSDSMANVTDSEIYDQVNVTAALTSDSTTEAMGSNQTVSSGDTDNTTAGVLSNAGDEFVYENTSFPFEYYENSTDISDYFYNESSTASPMESGLSNTTIVNTSNTGPSNSITSDVLDKRPIVSNITGNPASVSGIESSVDLDNSAAAASLTDSGSVPPNSLTSTT